MPFVSTLKESFALAPPQERQHVVDKLAVPNTAESYYYQGLVILQKIHDQVMTVEDPAQPRSPTKVESDLVEEMRELLSKLKAKNDLNYYNQLESRFQLLTYPFQTATTVEFLQKKLSISEQQQSTTMTNEQENTPTMESKLPSSLDPSLINGESLIRKVISEHENGAFPGCNDLSPLSYPFLNTIWEELSQKTQLDLIEKALSFGSTRFLGNDAIKKLVDIWKASKEPHVNTSYLENLTLAQMDELIGLVPDVVLLNTSFVHTYLSKLVPDSQTNGNFGFWDDQDGTLKKYLERANTFADQLPAIYKQLKSAIKFYMLRVDIIRRDFSEERLISFLSCVSNHSINTSPLPTRAYGSRKEQSEKSVTLPLFGSCDINEKERNHVIEEYLVGIIAEDKLTVSLESLGAYVDYHGFLKPLVAKIKLTSGSLVQDSWIKDYGETAYESLAKESFVSFAHTSLNACVKRKPSDTISLFVKTKNIARLSVRVFQIDTENYWRIHLDDTDEQSANKDINLDGFRPTFEEDFDFSSEPSIHVKYNEFTFGQGGLASDVFNGRGLWVIEFVGGENQCRAIIQKGYLRHIIQNTFAGHVLRVLDEDGQVIEKAKVLYDKQTYETDEASNILIPYQDYSQTRKVILVSSSDNYSEPASFYHDNERYDLKASFYINPEMVSFNKTATVVVVPELTLNGKNAPLSLLDDKMTLTVETRTTDDIKNISTCQRSSSAGDTIRFEFLVPDQLHSIDFVLKGKVKTLSDKLVDVSANYDKFYGSQSFENGLKATFYLRKTADGKYYIQVFGKNGEYKKDYTLNLSLAHALVQTTITSKLQTNENGIIELGELKDIRTVRVSGGRFEYKSWNLTEDYYSNLPDNVCVAENTNFKLIYTKDVDDCLFALHSVGRNGQTLVDLTATHLKKENGYISIQGLSEGTYKLHLGDSEAIVCNVINPQLTASEKGIWSGWLFGDVNYAKQSGSFLQNPLIIREANISDEGVQVKLDNWTPKTFAIVTTSTFVPVDSESLQSNVVRDRRLASTELQSWAFESTRSLFLNDKRISEEYQYILNRGKAEKWTGSNLSKPSLLVYPKKNRDTYASTRDYEKEVVKERDAFPASRKSKMFAERGLKMACGSSFAGQELLCKDLAFLDHSLPLVVIPVTAETGSIQVDRKYLGQGGHLLQMVVISGEQTVFYQKVISDDETLKFNDLRQSSNSNRTLIRSKAVSTVSPKKNTVLHTHEYETIDNFEKLFDTIIKISNFGSQLESAFSFLKSWSSLPLHKKLEIHQENVCHELNLWLKKKDTQFFEEFVKPVIKSKLQKEFMDLYLIDGDLSKYRQDIYLYNLLSVAEKALLAASGPTENLLSTLRSFNDSFDHEKPVGNADTIFDTILSQSALTTVTMIAETEVVEMATSACAGPMGYAAFTPTSPRYSPTSPIVNSRSFVSAITDSAQNIVVNETVLDYDQVEEEYENNENSEEQLYEMREKAKQLKQKASYKFAESTSEWTETGYYSQDLVSLQKFWIDYLESSKVSDFFVSENFIYSLDNIKEILFVLALMDLPFASEADWAVENTEATGSNKVEFSIQANSHPLLVFYRTLSECDGALASNANQNLMLNQEIFVVDPSTPIESEECIKVSPSSQSLEPLVEYGNHLIVINISSKTVTCQVTYQIPTGAIPTQSSSYYQSKTISINPYSTWHEVVSTFYFPSSGEFTFVPVAVSSISGAQLLGKIDAIPVNVSSHAEEKSTEALDSSSIVSQPWSKVASKGTSESVISYLESYRKLDKLDLSLISWRMADRHFARQTLDILSQRRHYDNELWKFGVGHQFNDAIQDLINNSSYRLLDDVGSVFESPLITKNSMDRNELSVYDYYPLFNARVHQMKPTPEILNKEFYQQYDRFLEYLSLKSSLADDTDLVILTTYLLLQDRIGEAHSVFGRVKTLEANEHCQMQIDYLQAYLKTRIPVTKDTSFTQQLDLQSIKDITKKYNECGVLRWRQLFSSLHDFVSEIEQGDFTVSDNSPGSKRIRSEPILEFEIDEQELIIKYANLKSVEIKYYDMDVEVMFSNNPFMDSQSQKSNKSISWIKPTASETIELPEKMQVDNEEEEEFDIIGISQMNSLQFHRVPFTAGSKNVFIEVSGGNITRQNAYYANSLSVHFAESFGIVCVTNKKTKRPLPGAYIKVYCRKRGNKQVHFWKDGYTGINGVFDYISVTQGNALTSNGSLKKLMSEEIEKLSVLVLSDEEGAMVKEVFPPEEN